MTKSLGLLRVLIVDDEPLARATLRTLLERDADIGIIEECGDGHEALQAIRSAAPHVLFLDVQMPGKDGFEVAELMSLPARHVHSAP